MKLCGFELCLGSQWELLLTVLPVDSGIREVKKCSCSVDEGRNEEG